MKQARGWAARVDRRLSALEAPKPTIGLGLLPLADDLVASIQAACWPLHKPTLHMEQAIHAYERWKLDHVC